MYLYAFQAEIYIQIIPGIFFFILTLIILFWLTLDSWVFTLLSHIGSSVSRCAEFSVLVIWQ